MTVETQYLPWGLLVGGRRESTAYPSVLGHPTPRVKFIQESRVGDEKFTASQSHRVDSTGMADHRRPLGSSNA